MIIGVLRIRLRVPADTRKEKRTVVKSAVERLRHRYNAAVVEAADLDSIEYATIAVACLSNEAGHADSQLQTIASAVLGWGLDAEILDIETELIPA